MPKKRVYLPWVNACLAYSIVSSHNLQEPSFEALLLTLTLLASSCSSASVGLCPITRMAQPSSRVLMKLSWLSSHSLKDTVIHYLYTIYKVSTKYLHSIYSLKAWRSWSSCSGLSSCGSESGRASSLPPYGSILATSYSDTSGYQRSGNKLIKLIFIPKNIIYSQLSARK